MFFQVEYKNWDSTEREEQIDMSSPRKRLVPKEISPPPSIVVNDDNDERDQEPDVDAM